jgi:uncharacterized protein
MKIFLDTSSLIKLYHAETGTQELDQLFVNNPITEILLSEIAKIEYDSAIWKKVSVGDLTKDESKSLISSFKTDYERYTFIDLNTKIVDKAKMLIAAHGKEGLRTLDSVQLASALTRKSDIDLFIITDKLLNTLAEKEKLEIMK